MFWNCELLTFTIALENVCLALLFFYLFLLLPTTTHFSPHHRLVCAVVKQNPQSFSKKALFFGRRIRAIFTTTDCVSLQELSQSFVLRLSRLQWQVLAASDRRSALRPAFRLSADVHSVAAWVQMPSLPPVPRGMLCLYDVEILVRARSLTMEWTTPQHEEIDLNCEVSSYANAEL